MARTAIAEQRGTSIVTPLVMGLIIALGGIIGNLISVLFLFFGMLFIYATIFFIDLPLVVNNCGIFIKIFYRQRTSVDELFSNFSFNYLRKVGGMAWMMLFTFLWSLLFVIPGLVKAYSYSMTQYILADCPNVTAKDALKLSMRMTNGHKLDLFVMNLSFLGWQLLGMLTCGILSVVFVGPYVHATTAGYYVNLRDKALATGVIHPQELDPATAYNPQQNPQQWMQ